MHMTNTANTKRLVLIVPDDFHHQLKVAAAEKRKDMRDLVIECVTACLDNAPHPSRTTEARAGYDPKQGGPTED